MRYIFSLAFIALTGFAGVSAQAASPTGKDFYGSIYVGPVVETHEANWANGQGSSVRSRNVTVTPDPGYNIGGSIGGWFNELQRMELSVGYRSYETEFAAANDPSMTGDVNVIPISFNNYFYPLMAFDGLLPAEHQPYFGFGIGIGIWSIDVPGYDDDFETVSVLLSATVGYDYYMSGLAPALSQFGVSSAIDNIAIGVAYEFSWANPQLGGEVQATATTPAIPFANEQLNQSSHIIKFTARYEF